LSENNIVGRNTPKFPNEIKVCTGNKHVTFLPKLRLNSSNLPLL